MKKDDFKKMLLWDDEEGAIIQTIAVATKYNKDKTPSKDAKFVNLYLKQFQNDITTSRVTKIILGTSGKSMTFGGNTRRVLRPWGTTPQTDEERIEEMDRIKEARANGEDYKPKGFLRLWDRLRGDTPQAFEIEDENGTITIVAKQEYNREKDERSIVLQLGASGKAIRIRIEEGTLLTTEVSEMYENDMEIKEKEAVPVMVA